MGADRRGPLAAFVVIAVIAVILLVTSVRSQASPAWLDRQLPITIVAVAPPPTSDLWRSVTGPVAGSLHQAVHGGVVLVRKATHDEPVTQDPTSQAAMPRADHQPRSQRGAGHLDQVDATAPQHAAHSDPSDVRAATTIVTTHAGHGRHGQESATGFAHGHGRHLGWSSHRQVQSRLAADAGHVPGHHLGWSKRPE